MEKQSQPAKRRFKQLSGGNGVTGELKFRGWKEWEEGDVLIGEYLSSYTDKYDKTCRVIRVESAEFQDGTGDEYVGKNIGINSCGFIEKGFDGEDPVEKGDIVQIEYTGTAKLTGNHKHAGKDSHTGRVFKEDSSSNNDGDGSLL